jgi:hypothetical protein
VTRLQKIGYRAEGNRLKAAYTPHFSPLLPGQYSPTPPLRPFGPPFLPFGPFVPHHDHRAPSRRVTSGRVVIAAAVAAHCLPRWTRTSGKRVLCKTDALQVTDTRCAFASAMRSTGVLYRSFPSFVFSSRHH